MTKIVNSEASSTLTVPSLEAFVREHVKACLQRVLEEEVEELLGRAELSRRGTEPTGYRNRYGCPGPLALVNGTVTVRRPRVKNLDASFVSRVLPLFQRRTPEVAELLPELYLHGLASGDFSLALRSLLGEGAPQSASSVQRLAEAGSANTRGLRVGRGLLFSSGGVHKRPYHSGYDKDVAETSTAECDGRTYRP